MPAGAVTGRPTSLYDWTSIGRSVSRATIATGPETLWRYASLLPARCARRCRCGLDAARRSDLLSDAARCRPVPQARGREPDRLLQGPHRDARRVGGPRPRRDHPLLLLDRQPRRRRRAPPPPRPGSRRSCSCPPGSASAAVATRHRGAHVFAVRGTYDDCRRLELELGSLFPWGFVSGNLHPYASEGAKTISFEIAEQLDWQLPDAVVCPAASGTLFSKLTQGFAELTRAGLAAEPLPRMFAGQALGSSPIAAAFADDREHLARRRRDRASRRSPWATRRYGDLALGAARATGGAVMAVADDEIRALRGAARRDDRRRTRPRPGGAALGALDRGARARRHRARLAGRARRHGRAAAVDGRRRRASDDDRRRRATTSSQPWVCAPNLSSNDRHCRAAATRRTPARDDPRRGARRTGRRLAPRARRADPPRRAGRAARPASSPRSIPALERARAGARPPRVRPLLPAREPRGAAAPAAAAPRRRAQRPRARASRSTTRSRSSTGADLERARGTSIRLVLTAHPTEATRRTVLLAHIRIAEQLYELDDPRLLAGRAAAIGGADRRGGDAALADRRGAARPAADHRRDPARPLVLRAQPDGRRRPSSSTSGASACPDAPPPLSFGSWIGGDMDGNPSARARIDRRGARPRTRARARALSRRGARARGRAGLRRGRSSASRTSSTSRWPATTEELPEYADEIGARNELEPYRRKLSFMWWRLGNDGYAARPSCSPTCA